MRKLSQKWDICVRAFAASEKCWVFQAREEYFWFFWEFSQNSPLPTILKQMCSFQSQSKNGIKIKPVLQRTTTEIQLFFPSKMANYFECVTVKDQKVPTLSQFSILEASINNVITKDATDANFNNTVLESNRSSLSFWGCSSLRADCVYTWKVFGFVNASGRRVFQVCGIVRRLHSLIQRLSMYTKHNFDDVILFSYPGVCERVATHKNITFQCSRLKW